MDRLNRRTAGGLGLGGAAGVLAMLLSGCGGDTVHAVTFLWLLSGIRAGLQAASRWLCPQWGDSIMFETIIRSGTCGRGPSRSSTFVMWSQHIP